MSKDKFPLPEYEAVKPVVLGAKEPTATVSLKYWHSGSQCLSDWQKSELAKLRKLIDKVQSLTPRQIRSDTGLIWKKHKGSAARGFARPTTLSKEIEMCELRVDSKARVHGAIFDGVFYLVWLDRLHAVFPVK